MFTVVLDLVSRMATLYEIDISRIANNILRIVVGIPLLLLVYYTAKPAFKLLSSPLRRLQGPTGARLFSGHMLLMTGGKCYGSLRRWRQEYGPVFAMRAFLGVGTILTIDEYRCVTTDPVAIGHILANSQKYHRPEAARLRLSRILGHSLLTAEGAEHRHQRKAINPAFSSSSLKNIFPSFMSKAEQLRDKLREQLGDSSSARVDMLKWTSRAALDIISLAGFNYELGTLRQGVDGSELARQIHRLNNPKKFPLIFFFRIFARPLRWVTFGYQLAEARRMKATIRKIGVDIIERKQRELELEGVSGKEGREVQESKTERDLLSLIVRLNMSTALTEKRALTMDQMLQQIPTFLIAGHETTANMVSWGLFALSQNSSIQTRLRKELHAAFPGDSASADLEAVNALPYLDAVVRETLRFHAAVEIVTRAAMEDDIVPLDRGYFAADGTFHTRLCLRKGDLVVIPILLINRLKEFWGEDAEEFNPDRWLGDRPASSNAIPGVWANVMTFSGGPLSCIGYQFASLEIKALLLHLVKAFFFELAVDPSDIMRNELIVTRPLVRSEREKGAQLPMILRPVTHV